MKFLPIGTEKHAFAIANVNHESRIEARLILKSRLPSADSDTATMFDPSETVIHIVNFCSKIVFWTQKTAGKEDIGLPFEVMDPQSYTGGSIQTLVIGSREILDGYNLDLSFNVWTWMHIFACLFKNLQNLVVAQNPQSGDSISMNLDAYVTDSERDQSEPESENEDKEKRKVKLAQKFRISEKKALKRKTRIGDFLLDVMDVIKTEVPHEEIKSYAPGDFKIPAIFAYEGSLENSADSLENPFEQLPFREPEHRFDVNGFYDRNS